MRRPVFCLVSEIDGNPFAAYFLAGARTVVACDISPFAIEAICRGAKLNNIPHTRLGASDSASSSTLLAHSGDRRLVVFHGDNANALPFYRGIATHVNMGLLPTARQAIPQALAALDPSKLGWLHFHEEVRVLGTPEERRAMEQEWAVGVLAAVREQDGENGRVVELETLHRVKQMAPTINHLVAQVRVSPRA